MTAREPAIKYKLQLLSGYEVKSDNSTRYYIVHNGVKVFEDEAGYSEAIRTVRQKIRVILT